MTTHHRNSAVFTNRRLVCAVCAALAAAIGLAASHVRADFNYANFTSGAGLTLNGDALLPGSILRLTPDAPGQAGSAWYTTSKQHLADGFDTTFVILMGGNVGGDGMAFVIQDDSATALGGGGSDLGFAGIPRSLAIEFDTFGFFPETDNHISVQTVGIFGNSASDQDSLAQTNVMVDLNDSNPHVVRIFYRPGALLVFLDNFNAPVIDLTIDLTNIDGDSILDANGDAWVGFTGATGGATETHDVESWSFDENDAPLPTGPCCTMQGCQPANAHDCTTVLGGFYVGPDGGECGVTNCDGACCDGDFCTDDVALFDCVTNGGTFRGESVSCSAYQVCVGACCGGFGAQCFITTESDCSSQLGTFLGAGTSCVPFPCPLPESGACCDTSNECLTRTAEECATEGGTWHGRGTDCLDVNCFDGPPALGACCHGDGECADGVRDFVCDNYNGTYNGDDSLCTEVNCSQDCGCAGATPLTGVAFFNDTTIGEPSCSGAGCSTGSSPSKVYAYTADVSGIGIVNTCSGANFATLLSVHTGCPTTPENQIDCNFLTCDQGAQVQFCAHAGETFYVRVGGVAGASGDFTLFALVIEQRAMEGPFQNPANLHWYYHVNVGPWSGAEAFAQTKGGHLVTINDAAENTWVNSMFNQGSLFIGLNDVASEGTFVWSSGQPVTYTNWSGGEPDNNGDQDYAVMQQDGTWLDLDECFANSGTQSVVEVENVPLPNTLTGPVRNPANCHDYYLLDLGTWYEAQLKAQDLGGELATINDSAENEWIRSTFMNFGGQDRLLWIGLSDRDVEGTFEWNDGAPLGYTNWNPGEPNDLGNEDYVVMNDVATGGWNDAHSGEHLYAVVELPGNQCLGDMDCSGSVTMADVPLFVQALLQPGPFTGCDIDNADMNEDTFENGTDIQLFVNELLTP